MSNCRQGHPLSGDNVVFASIGDGLYVRHCRTCTRAAAEARRAAPQPRQDHVLPGCPVCGRPSYHDGWKHYQCATGRPRRLFRPEERLAEAA